MILSLQSVPDLSQKMVSLLPILLYRILDTKGKPDPSAVKYDF